MRRLLSPSHFSAALAVLSVMIVLPAWFFTREAGSDAFRPTLTDASGLPAIPEGAPESVVALLTADPLTHYFGLPLTGSTIGYVVDGDSSMAPYIDKVAYLTNSVNASIALGARRYGIAQAVDQNGNSLVEVAEPVGDLAGARHLLTARLASGQTNLARALSVTTSWYADQLYLVMAKSVSEEELGILAQTAEQTGAVVNVIALGEAAKQTELADISNATHGRFIPVSDAMLDQLVERQRAAEGVVQVASNN